MVWFRYLSNKEVLGTTTPNENYSYPLLKRAIPKFTPKDTIPDKTWIFADVTGLNIDKYYDADLQLQTDDASYVVVYEDPYTDDYFVPVKTVIHEDILYFETAEEHPAGIEIDKQYAVYYKTRGLRKIVEVDNGGRKDYQIFDLPIWIDRELPVIRKDIQYNDAVYAYSVPPVTYSISAGRLPSGINIHPTTGQVTGLTSYEGLYFFRVRATSIHGYVEADFSNEVGTPPTVPTGTMPNFYFGQNYSYSFAVQSSVAVRYYISSGSLPDGVVLDEETGSVTGIVNLDTSNYSDVQYDFTVAYENEFSTSYKNYSGYVYHSPVFYDNSLSKSYSNLQYSDSVLASGYPSIKYSIEKYNFTANGIYTDENYNIYYDPNLSAGLLEFSINSNGEYLTTSYPQIMEYVKSIEFDSFGGFYIAGNFTAYDGTKIPLNESKKILYINNIGQLSTWSLKKDSVDYYGLVSPSFMKLISSNIYVFTENSGFYENSTNQSINYGLGVISQQTGQILDLNFHLRNGINSGYFTSAVNIGSNIYIGGSFTSVNLPPSSSFTYNIVDNTSLPNYPISTGQNVYAIHADDFGGYYIGGDFISVNGIPRNKIAHVNSLGKLSTWNPSSNGTVYAIATIGSNVYIGGSFDRISSQNVSNFVVITRFGQVIQANINVNDTVKSIDIVGSNIYFGGNFTKVSYPISNDGGVTISNWKSRSRHGLAAINSIGSLLDWRIGVISDSGSNTNSIKVNDSIVYFGGQFTNATYPTSSFYNVNKNGSVPDPIIEVSGNVYCVISDNAGGYYIGGDFHYVGNFEKNYLAHIDLTGTVTSWSPLVFGVVYDISLYGDNIYVGGQFTTNTSATQYITVVNREGLLLSWNPILNGNVYSIKVKDNIVYFAGDFTSVNGNARNRLAAVNTSGTLLDWNPNVNGRVRILKFDGDNIYIGGDFTSIGYYSSLYTLDQLGEPVVLEPIIPNPSLISAFAIDNEGGVYIGGDFTEINGEIRNRLAYINNSGLLTSWTPNIDGDIWSIKLLGSNVYIGGNFTSINGNTRSNLGAVNTSGNLLDWDPNVNYSVYTIDTYNEGATPTIYIGGEFDDINGISRSYVAAISDDGIPTEWNPNVSSLSSSAFVSILKIYNDNIYIGGQFTSVNENDRNYLASIDFSGVVSEWNPSADGVVSDIDFSSNNIYLAGEFTSINGNVRRYLAAVNTSGNVLPWNPNANSIARSLAILGDNIYISGDFTSIGTVNRRYLAAINTSGNLLSWNPSSSGYIDILEIFGDNIYFAGEPRSIAGLAQERSRVALTNTSGGLYYWNPSSSGNVYTIEKYGSNIYIGGDFGYQESNSKSSVYTTNSSGGFVGLNYGVGQSVNCVGYDDVGGIYVAGSFTSIDGQPRNRLAYINSLGYLGSFNPNVDGEVTAMLVMGEGATPNIYFAGDFFNVSSQLRNRLAAVNSSGNVLDWNPQTNDNIYVIKNINDNIYVGGNFTTAGAPASSVIKILGDASHIVPKYEIKQTIRTVAIDSSGGAYIGGDFTSISGQPRNRLAYINSSGGLGSWNPSANNTVYSLVISGDNIYVGGSFTSVNGNTRNRVAAINASGNVLPWNPNVNSLYSNTTYVYTIAISGDNIYIGGYFEQISGQTRYSIGLVNTSGSLINWTIAAGDPVYAIAISGDNIYLGGSFRDLRENTNTFGVTRRYIGAVNTSGNVLDWNPSASSDVWAIAIFGSNIYIGGDFTSVNGNARNRLAAINTTGNVLAWNPNANSRVRAMSRIGNNIYVGGQFTSVNGNNRNYVAAVNTSANVLDWNPSMNGEVFDLEQYQDGATPTFYVAGSFSAPFDKTRNKIAAVNTLGSLLPWNPSANSNVFAIDFSGENIFVGGSFTSISAASRGRIAGITTSGTVMAFHPNADGTVRSIKVSGSTVYFGGDFLILYNNTQGTWYYRRYAAAASTTAIYGISSWNPNLDATVNVIEIDSNNGNEKIYLGGDFTSAKDIERKYAAAFDTSGNLLAWNPSANASVSAISIFGSNVTIGGDFYDINSIIRPFIFAVDESATPLDWNPVVNDIIRKIYIDGEGATPNIYLAGDFTSINGTNQKYIAALDISNSLINWKPNLNNSVHTLEVEGDNVYFGGSFDYMVSKNLKNLGSINTAGFLTDFEPSPNDAVRDIKVIGSNVFFAGNFTSIKGASSALHVIDIESQEVEKPYLSINGGIFKVLSDGSGGVYISGNFTVVNGLNRSRVAHINSIGSVTAWNPNVNGPVYDMDMNDTDIYIAGDFSMISGQPRYSIAGIGKNGNLLDWNPPVSPFVWSNASYESRKAVKAIWVNNENIFIGGEFGTVKGEYRFNIAKLNTNGNLLNWYNTLQFVSDVRDLAEVNGKVFITTYDGGGAGGLSGFFALDSDTGANLGEIGGYLGGLKDPNQIDVQGNNIIAVGLLTIPNIFDGTKTIFGVAAINTTTQDLIIPGFTQDWIVLTDTVPLGPYAVATDTDNVYVAGGFNKIGGFWTSAYVYDNSGQDLTNFFVRDGYLVSGDSYVSDFAVDQNGGIYIAGEFSYVNLNETDVVINTTKNLQTRTRIAYINSSGKFSSWSPSINGYIASISLNGDNIYIGGNFTSVNGITRNKFAVLNSSGSLLQTEIGAGFSGTGIVTNIKSIGNNIYIAGSFTETTTLSSFYIINPNSRAVVVPQSVGQNVFAAALDSSGGIYIGGNFTSIEGSSRSGLAYINSSGGLTSWSPNANSNVYSISLYGDNIYIGGQFTSINGDTRNRLAAVNTFGSLLDWNPNANGNVHSILIYGDGATPGIYVGGSFTFVNGNTRNRLALINTSANVLSWNPNASATVFTLAAYGDNIYIGGNFATITSNTRNRLAVVNTSNINSTSNVLNWNPSASANVFSINIHENILYVGGSFTIISGVSRGRLAAFDTSGSILPWNPSASGDIFTISVNNDNVYVGGTFTSIGGNSRNNIAAIHKYSINSQGNILFWNPNANNTVRSIITSGSNIYVGGQFTLLQSISTPSSRLIAINTFGNIISWSPSANGTVHSMNVYGDNIYLGGEFTLVNGNSRNRLAAVNTTGNVLPWSPSAQSNTFAIAIYGNNVYLGGQFTSINGNIRNRLAAIDTSGTLLNWNPSAQSTVHVLGIFGDNIYIGGDFTSISSTTRYSLAAVNTSGSLLSWTHEAGSSSDQKRSVYALAFSGDNIYIGGLPSWVQYEFRRNLAIINSTGYVLDWSYSGESILPTLDTIEVDQGKLYFGDASVVFNLPATGRNYIAAANVTSNVLSWNPNANANVWSISIVGENIYFGGEFTTVGGSSSRSRFTGYDTSGTALNVINHQLNGPVYSTYSRNNFMYIGGSFTDQNVRNKFNLLGVNTTGKILSWNPNTDNTVLALASIGSNIYMSGWFSSINGLRTNQQLSNTIKLAGLNTGGSLISWRPLSTFSVSSVNVNSLLIVQDKIIGGGSFSGLLNPKRSINFVGLNNNSDTIFNVKNISNGVQLCFARDSIGGFYIGGSFTSFSQPSNKFASLNINGQILSPLDNAVPDSSFSSIKAIIPDSSGGFYIGGDFTSILGQPRNHLAYINSSGSLTSWNPNANDVVYALAISGSNIYVGGSFTSVNGNTRNRLAAINTTGNVLAWNPSADLSVFALAISGDNIYVGGAFGSVNGNTRNWLAAINTTGNVLAWNPSANNAVYSIVISGDNIYIGGFFTSVNGNARSYLAAVNTSGNVLPWNPNANNWVFDLTISGDNIYVGGVFTSVNGNTRNRLAAVNTSGNVLAWNPSANANVVTLAISGSNIYVGGSFTLINGNVRNRLAAVNTSGNVLDWNPGVNNTVESISVFGSNIYIGGAFNEINIRERNRLAYINSLGFITEWNPNVNANVRTLALSDSVLYVGGDFTSINGNVRNRLAAVNTSGNVLSWNPNVSGNVRAIVISGDNIYFGGDFSFVNGNTRNRLGAVSKQGTLLNFGQQIFTSSSILSSNSLLTAHVNTLAIYQNTIYIGGDFKWSPNTNTRYALLTNTSGSIIGSGYNAKILAAVRDSFGGYYVGGSFTSISGQPRNYLAYINSSGGLGSWNPSADYEVYAMAMIGSNVYIGGYFYFVSDENRPYLAAINTAGTLLSWNPEADEGVTAMTAFGSNIYVGGYFNQIAEKITSRIGIINTAGAIFEFDYEISDYDYVNNEYNYVNIIINNGQNIYIGGFFSGAGKRSGFHAINNELNSVYIDTARVKSNYGGVYTAAKDSSGGFYIGGYFSTINGTPRYNLAYINSSGGLGSWNPSASGTVTTLALLGNNIFLGGFFTSVNGNTRNYLAAINTSGNVLAWNPSAGNIVHTLAISGDNIYIGGFFTSVNGNTRNDLAAINTSGNVLSWQPYLDQYASIYDIVTFGDNIYLGGNFDSVNGNLRSNLAVLDSNGNLLDWSPSANNSVYAIDISGDNVYIGGSFTSINGNTRNRLAVVDTSGSLLPWNPSSSGTIYSFDILGDNIYTAGRFTSINGSERRNIAILNTAGSLLSWNLNSDSYSIEKVIATEQYVYLFSDDFSISSQMSNNSNLLGLNSSGKLISWNTNTNGNVRTLAITESNVYIGGEFTSVNGNTRNRLAAVDTSGALLDWNPNVNGNVHTIATIGSNIYIGGKFSKVSNSPKPFIAALNTSGSFIEYSIPELDEQVDLIHASVDKVLISGNFISINNDFYTGLISSNIQNGQIIPIKFSFSFINTFGRVHVISISGDNIYIGGQFTRINGIGRNHLAAINTSGKIINWGPNANSTITAIHAAGDNIYVGGNFTSIDNNTAASRLAVINKNGTVLDWSPKPNAAPTQIFSFAGNVYISGHSHLERDVLDGLASFNVDGSINYTKSISRTNLYSVRKVYNYDNKLYIIGRRGTNKYSIVSFDNFGTQKSINIPESSYLSEIYDFKVVNGKSYVAGSFRVDVIPNGLSLNQNTGLISGIPSELIGSINHNVIISAKNQLGYNFTNIQI